jgi:RNA-binding protein NOB1
VELDLFVFLVPWMSSLFSAAAEPGSREKEERNERGWILPKKPSQTTSRMTTTNSVRINVNSLVLDAAPLLTTTRLDQLPVDNFFTVPEVISEVKDARSRENLARQMQLIKLQLKSPSEGCMAQVIAFAKKTGDFAVLSLTDLKVIALAMTLEKEKNGGTHLRTIPAGSAQSTSNVKVIAGGKTLGYRPNKPVELIVESKEPLQELQESENVKESQELKQVEDEIDKLNLNQNSVEAEAQSNHDTSMNHASDSDDDVEEAHQSTEDETNENPSPADISTNMPEESDESDGWITPKNVARYKAKEFGHTGQVIEQSKIDVAVMSSDFAVQVHLS